MKRNVMKIQGEDAFCVHVSESQVVSPAAIRQNWEELPTYLQTASREGKRDLAQEDQKQSV